MSWYKFAPVEMIQSTKRGHSEPRGRQGARERHADGHVGLEHLLREELTRFAKPRGVVGEERPIDQVRNPLRSVDPTRIDALASQKAARVVCRVLHASVLAFLCRTLLICLGAGGG